MSRIYMNLYDDWGCGYYRCTLPVMQCSGDLSRASVSVSMRKDLHSDENNYDSYILHRIPLETSIFFLQKMQKAGKKFVLELDDDLFNIPEWMPSPEFFNNKWALKKGLEMADEVWVSTDKLAEIVNLSKTKVLPNLVDLNAFPKVGPAPTDPIRILWMGSMWHERDLEILTEPIERLIAEYGERVQFIFWGYLPTAFSEFVRVPGHNIAMVNQNAKYGQRVVFLDGVDFRFFYDRLAILRPYIGLAPLYDCQFNHSKSNLKFLEYTMAGAATVATKLSPYSCINDGADGFLVEPGDSEGWYRAIKNLIDQPNLRSQMVQSAKDKVLREFSWQSQTRRDLWVNAFRQLTR